MMAGPIADRPALKITHVPPGNTLPTIYIFKILYSHGQEYYLKIEDSAIIYFCRA